MIAEEAVNRRYSKAAERVEPSLCCPVEYNAELLAAIPPEVLEKDYGCGDPSRYLQAGETVLDLGSGAGKICFIASQIVGQSGKVLGVDMTDEMLEVARRNAPMVAKNLGYSNVEFRKGRIQDLALDLEALEKLLQSTPVASARSYLEMERQIDRLRAAQPLIASDSIDVVISNCVLNLVDSAAKPQLFAEIHRVLREGGRAVISDIVSDEPAPGHLAGDQELWSGCVAGALTAEEFIQAFEDAGFYGIEILAREPKPWRVVEGIEFRSITVRAWKGDQSAGLERKQAVVYRGPFSEVRDDHGRAFKRGEPTAVGDQTFELLGREPYQSHFARIEPQTPIEADDAEPFPCCETRRREPSETKGGTYNLDITIPPGCCSSSSCS